MPTFVGSRPRIAALNENVTALVPVTKNECPPMPLPSTAPSSASTESVMPEGANTEPDEAVTPAMLNVPLSKVSKVTVPARMPAKKGLFVRLRYAMSVGR